MKASAKPEQRIVTAWYKGWLSPATAPTTARNAGYPGGYRRCNGASEKNVSR
jgi:hypothetical protein